jgi:hypothetical protein
LKHDWAFLFARKEKDGGYATLEKREDAGGWRAPARDANFNNRRITWSAL